MAFVLLRLPFLDSSSLLAVFVRPFDLTRTTVLKPRACFVHINPTGTSGKVMCLEP
jgi:hypothetical protein